jgi:hypothetical protein
MRKGFVDTDKRKDYQSRRKEITVMTRKKGNKIIKRIKQFVFQWLIKLKGEFSYDRKISS